MRRILPILVMLAATPSLAAETWVVTRIEKSKVSSEIVAQPLSPARSGVKDMLAATAASGDIAEAWYSEGTGRYRHGALGDYVEGGALNALARDGRRLSYRLGAIAVFEDLYPRIADLDGDGASEVVTIESSLVSGSSIAVFKASGTALERIAATPHIGQPNRWLNIAAIAPFAGGKTLEIAFVATPHVGGKLAFLRFAGGRLTLLAAESGYSNHVFGSTELRLAAVLDADGDGRPELALPTQDRKTLRVVRLRGSTIETVAQAKLPAALDKAIAVAGKGGETVLTVGLEDGSVHEIRPPAK